MGLFKASVDKLWNKITANEHNMDKNPNWQEADHLATCIL